MTSYHRDLLRTLYQLAHTDEDNLTRLRNLGLAHALRRDPLSAQRDLREDANRLVALLGPLPEGRDEGDETEEEDEESDGGSEGEGEGVDPALGPPKRR